MREQLSLETLYLTIVTSDKGSCIYSIIRGQSVAYFSFSVSFCVRVYTHP